MTETVVNRAKRQGRWLVGMEAGVRVAQFVLAIALARLLETSDFGVVGVAMGVWSLVALFGSSNYVLTTLVAATGDVRELCGAAFWLNFTVAWVVTAIGLIVATAASSFYHDPRLFGLIALPASALIIRSLGTINAALLTRELAFRRVATSEAAASVFNTVLAVVFALLGFGAWSLLLPGPLAEALRVLLLRRFHSWRPDLHPRRDRWRGIYSYGRWVIGAELATQVYASLDQLIAGKLLGTASLGIYNRGLRFASFLVDGGGLIVGRIALPTLSALQDDRPRLAEVFGRLLQAIGMVALPAAAVIAVTAPDAVAFLFGEEKWGAAAPLVRILIPCVLLRTLALPASQVLYALGFAREVVIVQGAFLVPVVLAIYLGSGLGLMGLAIAMSISLAALAFGLIWRSSYRAGVGFTQLMSALWPGLSAGCVSLCAAVAVTVSLDVAAEPGSARVFDQGLRLVLATASAGVAALVFLRVFFPRNLSLLLRASGLESESVGANS